MDFVTMRTGGASTSGLSSHKQILRDHQRAFRDNGVYSNVLLESLRYIYKYMKLQQLKFHENIHHKFDIYMKTALITGITGQDGSYLAEFLLDKGYDVHGTIRRSSVDFRERIAHLEGHPNFHLHYADLGDSMSILQVVKR